MRASSCLFRGPAWRYFSEAIVAPFSQLHRTKRKQRLLNSPLLAHTEQSFENLCTFVIFDAETDNFVYVVIWKYQSAAFVWTVRQKRSMDELKKIRHFRNSKNKSSIGSRWPPRIVVVQVQVWVLWSKIWCRVRISGRVNRFGAPRLRNFIELILFIPNFW